MRQRFSDRSTIPRRFTCDGNDLSRPLEWSDAPAAMRSCVLLCSDPDAPMGNWHHWAANGICPVRSSLPEDRSREAKSQGFKQAVNDLGRPGYGGPCPPRRHGVHHYHFRLLALSVEHLSVRASASYKEARKHALAETVLVGIYDR